LSRDLVSIISLGCPKNLVDTERILGNLLLNGFDVTLDANEADTIIINTCAFLESARKESESVIEEFVEKKSKGKIKKIIVSGCYPSLLKKELIDKFPDVYSITGINNINDIVKAIKKPGVFVSDEFEELIPSRIKVTLSHYSYLKIADGCSHQCAFCLIPAIKGNLHSLPMDFLIKEAKSLAEDSVKELDIIAQDTTQYGIDLYEVPRLIELLQGIDNTSGLSWIRILYAYPSPILLKLLDFIRESKKVVPYLDIPIQHINNRILGKMRRGYSRKDVETTLTMFKEAGIALRTSVIVGFPSETEDEFKELKTFLREFEFDHLGIFEYSNEAGVESYKSDMQVGISVKKRRFDELMELKEAIAYERNKKFLGKEIPVIVDYYNKNLRKFIGRTIYDAPEIDDIVYINGKVKQGDIFIGKVVNASPFELAVHKKEGKNEVIYSTKDNSL
jgi:ribosomal protein S12 methylthiotransferase